MYSSGGVNCGATTTIHMCLQKPITALLLGTLAIGGYSLPREKQGYRFCGENVKTQISEVGSNLERKLQNNCPVEYKFHKDDK